MSISQNYPITSPSLSLDFANTKVLDPRITFSRPTSAVYYDGQTVTKAEENLFTYSQEFDHSSWSKNSGTITANTTVAPDGTTTADTVNPASGLLEIAKSIIIGAGTYTLSVFLSGSGTVKIGFYNAVDGVQDSTDITLTGTLTRYSVTKTLSASSTLFYPATTRGLSTVTSLVIWGAQLEARDTVTAYTPTTTQAITNYIPTLLTAPANSARFDHNPVTGESLGLLVEEQRTNLLLRSEEFDNVYWGKTNVTVTSNTVIAPDGTLTGDKLIPSTDANQHSLVAPDIPAGTYAWSAYFKSAEYIHAAITCFDGASYKVATLYDLENGTIVNSAVGSTSTITPVGNGWFRCTVSATLATGSLYGGAQYRPNIGGVSAVEGTAGDGYSGIYICGASLEQGSFSTSYIKTEASQVTRSADSASMTGTNFSDWYRTDEGTFYAEFSTKFNNGRLLSDTVLDRQIMFFNATTAYSYDGGNQVTLGSMPVANTKIKLVSTYSQTGMAGSLNGATVGSGNFDGSYNLSGLAIASPAVGLKPSVYISKISYYPIRCSNTQLQALTS